MMRLKPFGICAVILACAAYGGSAGTPLSVAKLTAFLQSSINLKMSDKDVAQYLKTVRLTDKLDMSKVEEFQGLGIGPKSIAILEHLAEESASLKAPPPPPKAAPPPPPMPPPDSIEQAKIIEATREYAQSYTKQLPNFLCVEVTRRYYDPSGSDSWGLLDTITSKLTYFDQQEKYDVINVTNHPDDVPLDRLGGVISRGEFGSQMKEIFEPHSHTSFQWARWATLRGRLHYVFAYQVPQEYSEYSMEAEGHMRIVPGYKGEIFVDKDTGVISRITLEPVNIPASFPVTYAKTTLDYDLAPIGDNMYMLPLRVRLISTSPMERYPHLSFRNDKEFRLYQKFGSEVKINFASGDALPEDQFKEQPAAPNSAPATPAPANAPVNAPASAPANTPASAPANSPSSGPRTQPGTVKPQQ